MAKTYLYLVCVIFFVVSFSIQAQEDAPVPPPLAFSNYNTDEQGYQVIDFATGETTTIARTGGIHLCHCGEFGQLTDFILQAADDPSRMVHFVMERDGENLANGYTLYALPSLDNPIRIMDGIDLQGREYTAQQYWSANTRFLYFLAFTAKNRDHLTLYQYEAWQQTAQPLLEGPIRELICYQSDDWCLVMKLHSVVLGQERYSTYLLDKNSGDLWLISQDTLGQIRSWWQADQSSFIYSLQLSDTRIALHSYDVKTHVDNLITELAVHNLSVPQWSPDHHWLAILGSVGEQDWDIFLVDTSKNLAHSEPIPIQGRATSSYLRWLTPDKLFYQVIDENGINSQFYVTTVSTMESQVIFDFPDSHSWSSIIDTAWSPDGRWLAVSFWGDTRDVYVIDSQNEVAPQKVPGDFSDAYLMCIGWYTPEAYATGQAYLCDMHVGMG